MWFFKKQKKEGTTIFRIWFVSGGYVDINTTLECSESIVEQINSLGWNSCGITKSTYGINFSLVTHYEVLNDE